MQPIEAIIVRRRGSRAKWPAPGDALALADDLSAGRCAGLGVLAGRIRAGQVRDQVGRQGGAVGREVRPLRQVEIVDEHKLVPVVAGQNEIGAGLLEMLLNRNCESSIST
jgi:hypothetical protein